VKKSRKIERVKKTAVSKRTRQQPVASIKEKTASRKAKKPAPGSRRPRELETQMRIPLRQIRIMPRDQIRRAAGPRIVVKFRDEVELPYVDGIERRLDRKIGDWAKLKELAPGSTFKRVFTSLSEAKLRGLVQQAEQNDRTYKRLKLISYFVLDSPERAPIDAVLNELRSWQGVETAYEAPKEVLNPGVGSAAAFPNQNALNLNESYLLPADEGVDVLASWSKRGGDGTGQTVIDLEGGWTMNHEDLADLDIQLLQQPTDPPLPDLWRPHGTSVLGVIGGRSGPNGFTGIAPGVTSVRVVSHHADPMNIPDRIVRANDVAAPGDVLVLETTITGSLPCEAEQATFAAIRTVVSANDLVVIEAAGNGNVDLDNEVDQNANRIFDPDFRDSGTILVGAATSAAPHARWQGGGLGSNVGARIDCYAWGENVFTTTWDANRPAAIDLYDDAFGGTSAATAIIAGVSLCIQGMAERGTVFGRRLTPSEMRQFLSDRNNGTAIQSPSGQLGVMPDLRKMAPRL
jgi:hypothetical protein